MDQHRAQEEHSSQVPRDQWRTKVDDAAGEGAGNHADQCDGHEEAEVTAGVLKEAEVVVGAGVRGGSEGEGSPPLLARPCSLLQLLLRACSGCLGLHYYGYCSGGGDYEDPKPPAAVDAAPDAEAAAAAAGSPTEGEGGGERPVSGYFYMQKVITRVWAVRRRPAAAPDRPREGPGGNGGDHH